MKKVIAIFLVLIIGLSLISCREKAPEFQQPLNCYYLSKSIQYNTPNAVISCEQIDGAQLMNQSLGQFLRQYLKGPDSEELISPFPAGTFLVHLTIDDQTVRIRLSSAFATLSGHNLTLACACLTLTVLDYTGLTYVSISVNDTALDDQIIITLDRNSIILLDPATNP